MAYGRHNEHIELSSRHYASSSILATCHQDLCLGVEEINTLYRVSNYVGYLKVIAMVLGIQLGVRITAVSLREWESMGTPLLCS
jgi:hypothetical protein